MILFANIIVDSHVEQEDKSIHYDIVGHTNAKGGKAEVADNKQHEKRSRQHT